MINTYLIREGNGLTTEIDLPTAGAMIMDGKLKYTGKKSKWNTALAEIEMRRFYMRVNRPAQEHQACTKPCCNYIKR